MAKTQTDKPSTAGTYDPRVLVFACNWCSYAGADTAGTARLPQTPHFRLLRVMCSGRIHPSFVLRAFARGADGVMVSGCHFGDCHYRFGNYRAAEQYEKTEALVAMLGLEATRLRLEWISAAEGIRFANLMNEFVEQVRAVGPSPLAPSPADVTPPAGSPTESPADPGAGAAFAVLAATRVLSCLECGRCTAVCPVAPYQTFSPRRLISRLVAAGLERLAAEPALWTCLTCGRCSAVCPAGVDYTGFVLAARAAAVAAQLQPAGLQPADLQPTHGQPTDGQPTDQRATDSRPAAEIAPCSHGGVFEQISIMHTRPALRQKRLGWLTEQLEAVVLEEGERGEGRDLLFVGCSPYFAAYFGGETGVGLTRMLRSAVALLNRAGIRPALLANERCCGHHLRIAGQAAEAARLEGLVAEQIRASGARRVIALCPECLVALRALAAQRTPGVEVVHLSEVLAAHREQLTAQRGPQPSGSGQGDRVTQGTQADQASPIGRVTYQDPCRLGRASGLYDPPRELLTDVAGVELVEMAHHGARAICCGNTAWLNCNAGTQRFQAARLAEAAATGSARLITACPGCFIHLRCAREAAGQATAAVPAAQGGSSQTGPAPVAIADIWCVLAEALDCAVDAEASGAPAGSGLRAAAETGPTAGPPGNSEVRG